jgi:hypothetical protein
MKYISTNMGSALFDPISGCPRLLIGVILFGEGVNLKLGK